MSVQKKQQDILELYPKVSLKHWHIKSLLNKLPTSTCDIVPFTLFPQKYLKGKQKTSGIKFSITIVSTEWSLDLISDIRSLIEIDLDDVHCDVFSIFAEIEICWSSIRMQIFYMVVRIFRLARLKCRLGAEYFNYSFSITERSLGHICFRFVWYVLLKLCDVRVSALYRYIWILNRKVFDQIFLSITNHLSTLCNCVCLLKNHLNLFTTLRT